MAQLMDYAGYLANEIGARPAGTEEEQQAALYITEQFQKEAGFTASIEEFTDASNPMMSRAIMALVVILVTVLAIIFPVLNIPAFILAMAATAIYVLEAYDRPIIAPFLARGASQNVVAKYQPSAPDAGMGTRTRARGRKIVLIAHYDTDHVTPPLVERVESLRFPLPLIVMCAMLAATFFQLLRIFVEPGGGMGLLVLNVLSVLALLVCLLPIVKMLLIRTAPYNEGANNNATGTAALIEVARRIARGSVSEADLASDADDDLYIHGEAAAREAGLIPEGAQIRYEAEQLVPPAEIGAYDEEERLLAAKAAIAAMTGKPVERRVFGSVADKLVNSRAAGEDFEYAEGQEYVEGQPPVSATPVSGYEAFATNASGDMGYVSVPASSGESAEAEGFENAPSWFIAAQQNARKAVPEDAEPVEVHRSKYTEAMEYAERERAEREEEARAAEWAELEAARRQREDEIRAAFEADEQARLEAEAQEEAQNVEEHVEEYAEEYVEEPAYPEAALGPEEFEPVVYDSTSFDADGYGSGSYADVPASPSSTIAMTAAPVPASEIRAEAAYLDGALSTDAHEEPDQPAPVEAAPLADIPSPLEQQPEPEPAANRIDLPAIEQEQKPTLNVPSIEETTSPSRSGLLRRLRTSVPSLSGLINPVSDTSQKPTKRSVNRAVVESVPSVITAPSPVDEPAATPAEAPAVDRVDYNMEVTFDESSLTPSEPAAPSMEVPRSRSASLLSRLNRGGEEDLAETPQQWLDIDENYEARSVGRERGSWESFRDDDVDEFGTGDDDRRSKGRWQGGAYSRMSLGHVDMRSGAESEADEVIPAELPPAEKDASLTGEIEQIYHFRNPQFNTEIWFVAIGSDSESHDGMRAFLAEHRDELRGSMIIEIESLGAGDLSVASAEGRIRKVSASSRIKRYTRSAIASTGVALDEVSLVGTDSIASMAQKSGLQAMHLFGAENGKPALKNSADDVLENIDELLFDDNVNFVFELLKH